MCDGGQKTHPCDAGLVANEGVILVSLGVGVVKIRGDILAKSVSILLENRVLNRPQFALHAGQDWLKSVSWMCVMRGKYGLHDMLVSMKMRM